MSESLDMSLDEIIRNNKNSAISRGRDRSFGSRAGPIRRFANRGPPRPTPYVSPMVQQMHQERYIGGAAPHNNGDGTKLYISNLEYGVSNQDIQVLFSEVGELKRYSIHYDKSGRSKGTAEVVYVRQSDALAALKRYNNLQLDGKPMNIELVGMNIVTPVAIPPASRGILGNPVAAPRRFNSRQDRVVSRGGDWRSGTRGVRRSPGQGRGANEGRSRGQGRGANENLSIEDLDADLEKYRLEAMKIN